MLTLYANRLSINVRRVWVLLLEKQIPFEPVWMPLEGEQLQPEFLALNPFHHVPVLVEDGFRVIESLAILDYLEARYPSPLFMPAGAQAIATLRMAAMVTVNELAPATFPLMLDGFGLFKGEAKTLAQSRQKIDTALRFFEPLLAANAPFLLGEQLTLADIVVGTALPLLERCNYPLDQYPQVQQWLDRLMQRQSWQQTEPPPAEIAAFKQKLQRRFSA